MTNDKKQAKSSKKSASKDPEIADQEDETSNFEDDFGELPPGPVELLEIEIADLKDRYIRLAADMENLRKRTERERLDTRKYAVSEIARDILSLSDNFQRAIDTVPLDAAEQDEVLKSFLDGIKMNERELQKVLERHGVTKTNPQGEKFDPNIHQAVQQVENAELPNNTVCEVLQVGYVIYDRVLRPAVVTVTKGGPKTLPETAETAPETNVNKTAKEKLTLDGDKKPDNDIGSTIDKNA